VISSLSLPSSSPQWRIRLPRILGPFPSTTTLIKSLLLRNNASNFNANVKKISYKERNSKFISTSSSICMDHRKRWNGSYSPSFRVDEGKNVKILGTWRNFCSSTYFRVSDEVRVGVEKGEPIVALESAIITHGMPVPHNVETAFHLQNIVRQQVCI
jgi:hypothetical protein